MELCILFENPSFRAKSERIHNGLWKKTLFVLIRRRIGHLSFDHRLPARTGRACPGPARSGPASAGRNRDLQKVGGRNPPRAQRNRPTSRGGAEGIPRLARGASGSALIERFGALAAAWRAGDRHG